MKKILILLVAVLISSISCKKDPVPAAIGKQVPKYTFENILNSNENEINLRDLRGKIVILEFWATWCGPCIPAMKKMESLQNEFKDKLEVIAISSENQERLKKFIEKTNNTLKITSDSAHTSYFKYKVIPHSIIIDKSGIVRAITNPDNIDSNAIANLISNNKIDLAIKDDFYIDPSLSVKTIKSVANSDYRIELKNYDQEKRGGSRILKDPDGIINGIEIWNSPIPRLYQTLFDIASPARMIFKNNLNSVDFPYEKEHQYNMIIEVSDNDRTPWKQLGIAFLNENLEINARMGIDTLSCFVLRDLGHIIKESTSEKSEYMFIGPTLKTKKIKISRLTEYIENFTSLPVIDKTGLDNEYDIDIEWQFEDPETLHSELKKYGLKLEKSIKKLPVEVMYIYKKAQ